MLSGVACIAALPDHGGGNKSFATQMRIPLEPYEASEALFLMLLFLCNEALMLEGCSNITAIFEFLNSDWWLVGFGDLLVA